MNQLLELLNKLDTKKVFEVQSFLNNKFDFWEEKYNSPPKFKGLGIDLWFKAISITLKNKGVA